MKTRKTTTVTRPTKPALLIALAALTLAGPTPTEARTGEGFESASPVTVIGRDQIRNTPTISRDISDFTRLQPGIVAEGYGDNSYGTANINLRGVSPRTNNVYMDGIPHTPTGLYVNPSQIERVEVLRGPQGTLYGRNTLPGTVNLNTRYSDRVEYVETTETEQPYTLGAGYKYNDLKFNPGLNYDTNTLGTGRLNTGLKYDQTEPAYTPDLTVGQNWNTGRITPTINPEIKYDNTQWNTDLTTAGAGLNTTLNTGTTETASNPTHTPTETTTANTHDNTTAQTDTAQPTNTHQPNDTQGGTARETGDSTGIFNQPATTYNGNYNSPCPKVNRHEINNRIANGLRMDAAYQATGLLQYSQPHRFFDYNYYNTAADELANRDYLSGQLAQSVAFNNGANAYGQGVSGCIIDPRNPGVGGLPNPNGPTSNGNDAPKTYYRVAGGGDYTLINDTTKTELPPIPDYKTTVRPLNPSELNDRQLEIEIKYGPSLIEGYQREAKDQRDEAEEYREWAKKRRVSAARARANAEEARKKAKDPNRRDSSRKFWEEQAEAYDDHAEILEDSAELNDHSAKNADAVAERYEQDAQQTAENLGRAVGEFGHRQGQAAAKAAQAQAARDAEAARVEAQRKAELDELLRMSQQGSQNSAGTKPRQNTGPRQPNRPDERIPRPGREPRNETIRKLLD